MNKLIIAVAAMSIGFAAQAVTYNWKYSTSNTAKKVFEADAADRGATISSEMYVIWGLSTSSASSSSKDSLITQLRALDSGWDTAITGNANYLGNTATGKGSATLSSGQLASAVEFSEGVSGGTTLYAYAVILSTDKAGNTWAYISGNSSAAGGEQGTLNVGTLGFDVGKTSVYDLDATQTGKQSGWYQLNTAAVPEPTSGLLLLLGMAGLALRRRRA